MCLAIYSHKGQRPHAQLFENAHDKNPDGWGLAWGCGSKVKVLKGLKTHEDAFDTLSQLPAGTKWLAHARYKTEGAKIPELTHPFVVSETSPLRLEGTFKQVLFHNGTYKGCFDDLKQLALTRGVPIPRGDWSDSRIVAVLIHHLGHEFLRFCGDSRYAVTTSQAGQLQCELYGDWTEQNGFMLSNTRCDFEKPKPKPASSYSYGSGYRSSQQWRQDTFDTTQERREKSIMVWQDHKYKPLNEARKGFVKQSVKGIPDADTKKEVKASLNQVNSKLQTLAK